MVVQALNSTVQTLVPSCTYSGKRQNITFAHLYIQGLLPAMVITLKLFGQNQKRLAVVWFILMNPIQPLHQAISHLKHRLFACMLSLETSKVRPCMSKELLLRCARQIMLTTMVFVKRIIGRESTEGKRTKEGIKTKNIIDLELTDQTLPYKLIYLHI